MPHPNPFVALAERLIREELPKDEATDETFRFAAMLPPVPPGQKPAWAEALPSAVSADDVSVTAGLLTITLLGVALIAHGREDLIPHYRDRILSVVGRRLQRDPSQHPFRTMFEHSADRDQG